MFSLLCICACLVSPFFCSIQQSNGADVVRISGDGAENVYTCQEPTTSSGTERECENDTLKTLSSQDEVCVALFYESNCSKLVAHKVVHFLLPPKWPSRGSCVFQWLGGICSWVCIIVWFKVDTCNMQSSQATPGKLSALEVVHACDS